MCRISHRFLRCFADSRLFAHAGLDLQLSFSSVRGWGGLMTSMRMRLVSSVSFVALLLKRCRLLVKPLLPLLLASLLNCQPCKKPRVFEACQTKTSQRTPKIIKHKRRNAWYLRQFRKQKRNQIILLRNIPTLPGSLMVVCGVGHSR